MRGRAGNFVRLCRHLGGLFPLDIVAALDWGYGPTLHTAPYQQKKSSPSKWVRIKRERSNGGGSVDGRSEPQQPFPWTAAAQPWGRPV